MARPKRELYDRITFVHDANANLVETTKSNFEQYKRDAVNVAKEIEKFKDSRHFDILRAVSETRINDILDGRVRDCDPAKHDASRVLGVIIGLRSVITGIDAMQQIPEKIKVTESSQRKMKNEAEKIEKLNREATKNVGDPGM